MAAESHSSLKLALAAIAVASSVATAGSEHWTNVKGPELAHLFANKEFGDRVHFAYQFKAGGTFTGTEMAKSVSGTWRVRKDEFCWKWLRPPGGEECYQVQQDGSNIRMMINGSEAWYGTLAPRQ